MNICLAIVRYSIRCRCFHSALKDATEALQSEKELQGITQLKFWKAVSMGKLTYLFGPNIDNGSKTFV